MSEQSSGGNPEIAEDFSARRSAFWGNVLLFCCGNILYLLVNFQRSAVPGTIFNELQMYFNASATEITQIGAVFMGVYAFVQLAGGMVVDRYGGARVITAGGLLIATGALCFPFCQTLGQIYCCRVLIGIGCGAAYLGMVKEIDRIFPKRFSFYLGLLCIVGFSGTLLGTFPLAWAVKEYGWQKPFVCAGGVVWLTMLGYILCLRKVPIPAIRREKVRISLIFEPYLHSYTRNLFISNSLVSSSYYVMIAFIGKKFMEDCAGFSSYLAGICLMVMAILSAFGSYLAGMICTRWPGRRLPVYRGFLLAGSIGSFLGLLMLLADWHSTVLAFFIMMTFGFSLSFGVVSATIIREVTPQEEIGMTVGTGNGTCFVVIAIVASLAGVLMDLVGGGDIVRTDAGLIYPKSSYLALFLMLSINSLIALLFTLKLTETYGRNISRELRSGQTPRSQR